MSIEKSLLFSLKNLKKKKKKKNKIFLKYCLNGESSSKSHHDYNLLPNFFHTSFLAYLGTMLK